MLDHKEMLDTYLLTILGSKSFVDQWWESSNVAFNLRSPIEIYSEEKDGPEQVENYILSYCNLDYH